MEAEITKEAVTSVVEDMAYWQYHKEAYLASGLTKSGYSQLHQISYDRFRYWMKKLSHTKSTLTSLMPVNIKATAFSIPSKVLCTVTMKNGGLLQIYDPHALMCILEKMA